MDWDPGWAFVFVVDGEKVGPVRSDPLCVHTAARESISHSGGTAVVLRATGRGWRTVATYTAETRREAGA